MISVEHLTKCYGGFKAVDDLSFEIDEGHVYGFLGPNGAGKSTTMNIMTGCLSATEGSVKIDGYDIFEDAGKAKKLIGYLPEQPPLYMNETPMEYLRFVGETKWLHGAELESQIEEVIRQTKIGDVKGRRISSLSKGYKHELRAYFHSLTAYVFGAFLLAFVGIGAMMYNLQAAVSNFEYVLSFGCLVFVVIVPILTMRVIAEERKQKTDQLL